MAGKYIKKHIYSIGQIIESVNSGRIEILECIRLGKRENKGYKYRCLDCNNEDFINEYHLKNNRGCNVCCRNPKVKVGFNDMHTTAPWMINILWNRDDGYKYTSNSARLIDWKCDNCNHKIKNKSPNSIYSFGLSCPRCSDGISYPNKIMYSVLQQSTQYFENEKVFKWSLVNNYKNKKLNGVKKYDFYIPSIRTIVEMHGAQHYTHANRGRSLETEQENDILKLDIALSSGEIDNYIVIRADISELNYIKNNIINSKLNKLVKLHNVNWESCDKYATKSLVVEVCDYYMKGIWSSTEIGSLMKKDSSTIRQYLNKGVKMGMCNYNPNKSKENSVKIAQSAREKGVICLSLDNKFINFYKSATQASKELNIGQGHITSVCRGKRKSAGGFKWMYLEEYKNT